MRALKVAALLFASLCPALAQVDPGFPTYGVYKKISPFETVNVGTNNVILSAPVRGKDGAIRATFNLESNALLYNVPGFTPIFSTATTGPVFASNLQTGAFINGSSQGLQQCTHGDPGQYTAVYLINSVFDGFGTKHTLTTGGDWDTLGCMGFAPINSGVTDNSGYTVEMTPGQTSYVIDKSGYKTAAFVNTVPQYINNSTITDPHGNTLTFNVTQPGTSSGTITDQLTTNAVLSFNVSDSSKNGNVFSYIDGAGVTRNITVNTFQGSGSLQKTNFNLTGCPNVANNTSGNTMSNIQKVTYPDNSTVQFGWETTTGGYTGRISTVTVPTGGIYTHTYSGGSNGQGIWCNDVTVPGSYVSNATMTISNGSGTWTFARTVGTHQGDPSSTTITNPDGSKEAYTFWNDIPTQKITYDTDGSTVLETLNWCYWLNGTGNCHVPPVAPMHNPFQIFASRTVPGVSNPSQIQTNFDTFGNMTTYARSDFGGPGCCLISTQSIAYGSYDGTQCNAVGNNIKDRPCTVNTRGHDGLTITAATEFQYNSAGDLTKRTDGVQVPNLVATASYNANGTMASSTGVDGVTLSSTYTQCNGFLPDSVTNAVGTEHMTWSCDGAVPLTVTDLNGKVKTNTYGDAFWRVTQTSDNGGQAPINYVYTSPTQTSTHMVFNSGNSIDDTTITLDSLGRILSTQRRQSPTSSNYDTISFGYDNAGHRTSTSVPCVTTLGGTCSTHANEATFDGMGRVKTETTKTSTPGVLTHTYQNGDETITLTPVPTGENAKVAQIERDGLDRITSTGVITSLAGSGSLGQRTAGSGYLTKYVLNERDKPTQISRNSQAGATPLNTNFMFDDHNRVTSASFPESGTSTFLYDTVPSACVKTGSITGLLGHLNQSANANVDVLCYSYNDFPGGNSSLSSGRLAEVFPVSGPNLSITPNRYFVYGDGTTNGTDRLAQQYTTPCDTCTQNPNGQPTTNTYYNYDIYGRVTQQQQTSLGLTNSEVYLTTTAGYFDNGVVQTLTGIPGVPSYTFGIDGEGRPSSATAGSTTIVSSVAYSVGTTPTTTINYGDGDKDVFTFDPASSLMTQWQYTVGSTPATDTGAATWNPNQTLSQLAITDNVPITTDTQTCAAGHDDLLRIGSFNCGSKWSETYSYTHDLEGNVTKSGSLNFNPGYVAATNRYASASGCTYDAGGDLLHDCQLNLNYTWDGYGVMVSEAGTSLLNDAFGNMLQKGSSTFVLYSPVGKIGTVTTTAPVSAVVPLPAGASITYTSSSQILNHTDFHGSTRLRTNFTARTLVDVFCYGPMGELYCGSQSSSQYEGTQQTTASGLDDFDATRYSGAQGRDVHSTGGVNGYVKDNSPF